MLLTWMLVARQHKQWHSFYVKTPRTRRAVLISSGVDCATEKVASSPLLNDGTMSILKS